MRLVAPISLLLAIAATAQAPPGYYNSVITTSPLQLRSTLHAVIDDHTRFPYTASSTDTWDILELADQNPGNANQILDLYKNAVYPKMGGGQGPYNREHTWPNSYGFPNDGPDNYPYTDCHQLFLCDTAYNAARGNLLFDNGNSGWQRYATDVNAGQGGGSSVYPGNSNWAGSSGWEVWSQRKGDVARALLYLDVRYEGGTHGVTGADEPDLVLTDNPALVTTTGSNTTSVAYMGKLGVLLQWHAQDPVDTREMARNNVVYGFQGNRNPFIDHPEWVDCLFSGSCGTPTTGREAEVWINELHYDNVGTDVGEFVEVAGRAGERLDGWLLIGYDGTTGQAYGYVRLRGALPNQQNGFGTLSFPFAGLENGSPDGLALVAPNGAVMQLLSYEGVFAAVNGAAKGRTSVDIGASELPTTPVGQSLRLTGTGSRYSQFAWQPAATSSPGSINAGQTFQ